MSEESQVDVRTLIAQHAMTSRLLGVDFLPLGSVPESELVEENFDEVAESKPTGSKSVESKINSSDQSGAERSRTDESAQPIEHEALRRAYSKVAQPQAQLDALRAMYERQAPHQHYNTGFTNIVFGEGSATAELMFIGEAPGEDEDLSGRPFVGRAGQLLEKMIGAMGLSRETVYICNVLKTRPPNNATPSPFETSLCAPYLFEQIRIINPKVIVTLGLPATQLMLNTKSAMRTLRGRWHTLVPGVGQVPVGIPEIEVMATYHPAYLLRSYTEENRRNVWSDLVQVMEKLGISGPAR